MKSISGTIGARNAPRTYSPWDKEYIRFLVKNGVLYDKDDNDIKDALGQLMVDFSQFLKCGGINRYPAVATVNEIETITATAIAKMQGQRCDETQQHTGVGKMLASVIGLYSFLANPENRTKPRPALPLSRELHDQVEQSAQLLLSK